MSFSEALELLKQGRLVSRKGWNGTNMFVELIRPCNTKYTKGMTHEPYFIIKTVRNTMAAWVPSTGDVLANDWEEVK